MTDAPAKNTDTELWREVPDDYYSPSVHVTLDGKIGIRCGGRVVQMYPAEWVRLGWTIEQEKSNYEMHKEP